MHLPLIALLALSVPTQTSDVGPLVRALWLVQHHGAREALRPSQDQHVKAVLAKALARDGVITLPELEDLMESSVFNRLAGSDGKLDAQDLARALESATPLSRTKLLPRLREHADYLTTGFDLIDEPHRQAGEQIARWIVANYQPGQALDLTAICTANSRRSFMCATMGNLAAAYYGMPEIQFHSGGTGASAFNPRTVRALRSIGFEIEPTGKEAERGEAKTANPIYRVRWGEGFDLLAFSKRYDDSSNPQGGFAALMVCGEADAGCPVVKGAAIRISMPYLDPKIYDDGSYEAAKYAERRDDMGRLLLSVIMQARREIALKEPAAR